ncbi:MAG: hypothetical protein M3220_20410 [Chloroflexota bacterium]|nr:hypothetical protein [Chloroflexota bacterium]
MTLVIAWIREVAGTRELVVAADSRVRGGYAWDAAPKLLPLDRGDAVIAYAGDSLIAYPVMLQIQSTVRSWDKAANRRQPLEHLKGHLLRVLNAMLQSVSEVQAMDAWDPAAVRFVLAGYSWRRRQFVIWELHYDANCQRFHYRTLRRRLDDRRLTTSYVLVGDGTKAAKALLCERLHAAGRLFPATGLDMEPLAVLAAMIEDPAFPSIGGAPQVVKVYEYLDAVPFVVDWQDARFYAGRELLEYEAPDRVAHLPVRQFGYAVDLALIRERRMLATYLRSRLRSLEHEQPG